MTLIGTRKEINFFFKFVTYDLNFRSKETGEIIIKTKSDYWIVGKISNLREFFVVIQQKNASIIEIDGNDSYNYLLKVLLTLQNMGISDIFTNFGHFNSNCHNHLDHVI